MAGGTKGAEGSSSGSVDLGVEQLHDLGKSSQDKILSTHLVDKVVCLAGSLTDSLVDSGAGLLGHVGALLLVLGGALLLVLRGASLAGSSPADVLSHLLAHLLGSGLVSGLFLQSLQYSLGVIDCFAFALVDDRALPLLNSGALDIVHCLAQLLLHNAALFLVDSVALLKIYFSVKRFQVLDPYRVTDNVALVLLHSCALLLVLGVALGLLHHVAHLLHLHRALLVVDQFADSLVLDAALLLLHSGADRLVPSVAFLRER